MLLTTRGIYEEPHKEENAINEDRNKEETTITLLVALETTNARTKRRRRLVFLDLSFKQYVLLN